MSKSSYLQISRDILDFLDFHPGWDYVRLVDYSRKANRVWFSYLMSCHSYPIREYLYSKLHSS